MINFDQEAQEIYAQNKAAGWWDDPNRCSFRTLQLVSTEIAEATEGERKNLMDDHLPLRKMGEVELADALIRILDFAGRYGWEYEELSPDVREEVEELLSAATSVAGKHAFLGVMLSGIIMEVESSGPGETPFAYSGFVEMLEHVAHEAGYDLHGAMREKLEYNKTRADHKRESRAQDGGKKF